MSDSILFRFICSSLAFSFIQIIHKMCGYMLRICYNMLKKIGILSLFKNSNLKLKYLICKCLMQIVFILFDLFVFYIFVFLYVV